MPINSTLAVVALFACASWNAKADSLTLQNGYTTGSSDDVYGLTLTDFQNNAGSFAVYDGNSGNTSRAQLQGNQFKWNQGDNYFGFTYNPGKAETFQSGTSLTSLKTLLTYNQPAFGNPINYVHVALSARNGTTDSFSLKNLTITSLDGKITYLAPQTFSASNGYFDFQAADLSGDLLKYGFKVSADLNLPNALKTYNKGQTDKVAISAGYNSKFVPAAPGAPAPPMTACLAFAGVLVLQAWRTRKVA
jgi:hypothetical protein